MDMIKSTGKARKETVDTLKPNAVFRTKADDRYRNGWKETTDMMKNTGKDRKETVDMLEPRTNLTQCNCSGTRYNITRISIS